MITNIFCLRLCAYSILLFSLFFLGCADKRVHYESFVKENGILLLTHYGSDDEGRIEIRKKQVQLAESLFEKDSYSLAETYPLSAELLAEAHARMAYTYLVQDMPKLAKKHYIKSFLSIQKGIENSNKKKKNSKETEYFTNMVLGVATAAAGSYYASQGYDHTQAMESSSQFFQKAEEVARSDSGVRVAEQIDSHVIRFPFYSPDIKPGAKRLGLQKIGRVLSGRQSCTGAPIGKRLVLTNAHCVTDDNHQALSENIISFQFETSAPSRNNEDSLGAKKLINSKVLSFYTHKGKNKGYSGKPIDDWAILVLEKNIINKNFFKYILPEDNESLTAGSPNNKGEFVVAGYSSDLNKGKHKTVDWGCDIVRVSGPKKNKNHYNVEHNCNSFKGSSGSPLLLIERGKSSNSKRTAWLRFKIVAVIHTGSVDKEGNPVEYDKHKGWAVTAGAWHETAKRLNAIYN